MTAVDHIKAEIEDLSAEDFSQLREWFAEKDWQLWDDQIKADSAAGKLAFLHSEATSAKAKRQLRDL